MTLPSSVFLAGNSVVTPLRLELQRDDWCGGCHGWEGEENSLKLVGWDLSRHVAILRRPIKQAGVVAKPRGNQIELVFPGGVANLRRVCRADDRLCPGDFRHRPVLSRTRQLGERLRQTEKPVGLGASPPRTSNVAGLRRVRRR